MALTYGYYQQPGHVIVAGTILAFLALAVVLLRIWTRVNYGQGIKADDWLIVPAAALTVGQGINLIIGVANHALATTLVIPPEFEANPLATHTAQVIFTSKVEYAYELMLPLTLGLIKLSFLLFYMRIFAVSKGGFVSILLWLMIVLVSLWTVVYFFVTLFQCRLDFWARTGSAIDKEHYCFGTFNFVYSICLSDFLFDVLIIAIPIPLVWRLKLSMRKKMGTVAIFLLGAVAIAASLTRLIMTVRIVYTGFDPNADVILTITTYMYWGMVECGAAVIAACLPSLSLLARSRSLETAWQSLVSRFSPSSSRLDSSRHRGEEYVDMSDSHNRKLSEEPIIHMKQLSHKARDNV